MNRSPERLATYLWAFGACLLTNAFCWTGDWVFFWIGLFWLIMFYSHLEWEFEKIASWEKYDKISMFNLPEYEGEPVTLEIGWGVKRIINLGDFKL